MVEMVEHDVVAMVRELIKLGVRRFEGNGISFEAVPAGEAAPERSGGVYIEGLGIQDPDLVGVR